MSTYQLLVIFLFTTCGIAKQLIAQLPSQALSDDEIQEALLAQLAKNKGKTASPKFVEEEPHVVMTPSGTNSQVTAVDTTNFNFKPFTGSYKGPFDLSKLIWEKNKTPAGSCNNREKTLVCPTPGTYICISPEQLCDSKRDCPDGADEHPTHCMFSRLFEEYDQVLTAKMRKIEANVAVSKKEKARLRKLRNKNKNHSKRDLASFYHTYNDSA